MIYLDTHVVAWLFAGETTFLGDAAREALERDDDLRISPMVLLELGHLREIERIKPKAEEIIAYLSCEIGLSVCEQLFT
jgi:PIN domain nuclease of toxin-antitoxin system